MNDNTMAVHLVLDHQCTKLVHLASFRYPRVSSGDLFGMQSNCAQTLNYASGVNSKVNGVWPPLPSHSDGTVPGWRVGSPRPLM